MKITRLCVILLLLIVSIGVVSATEEANDTMEIGDELEITQSNEISYTFTNLTNEIEESQDSLELQHDYTFNNESDTGYVVIKKDNFTINGNNHILDGNKQSGIFNITGNNVTISNLVFMNGKTHIGGTIYSTGEITLNNITFISNEVTYISDHTQYHGGAIASYGGKINCYNSRFIDNYAESGSAIFIENGELNVKNTYITSNMSNRYGQIWARKSLVNIENVDFINISSIYSPAMHLETCIYISLVNSSFVNLTAEMSAGAVCLKREGNIYIKGCKFINTKSFKNAGAINIDYLTEKPNATIIDTVFNNASSMIGGAVIQLGGNLLINNSNFTNNHAIHYGGAVYIADTVTAMNNCIFDSNGVEEFYEYEGLGGAIYSDLSDLNISNSKFLNNSAGWANAIYACDGTYIIVNSIFANNTNAIATYFDDEDSCILENNTYNNDTVFTDQTFEYARFVDSPALVYDLINNTINVTSLPSKFDLRDWGWVSPVKNQGHMGACWTFGMLSALESAMLKSYGVEVDLSEGNLQHNMLGYFPYGLRGLKEGGWASVAASYLLGWYGPAFEETDVYDEVGKLSPFITSGSDVVHIQDAIYIPYDDMPNGTKLKSAILKYGTISVSFYAEYGDEGYYDPVRASHYVNESKNANHQVSVIGWDDTYSKDNFLITPPGDGAWIIKNSWGTDFGDNGIMYISYYDKSFARSTSFIEYGIGIIIENTIPYNKNYQHDFTWLGEFWDLGGTVSYANVFDASEDDLIAGVGTYFDSEGVNYTVEIFVNDDLKLIQDGVSPFVGYHTIKLNEYVPVKEGDEFYAVITSNKLPFIRIPDSRVHYNDSSSFFYFNDHWYDLYYSDLVACLKIYTVEDDSIIIDNKNISVNYGDGAYFSVKVTTPDGKPVGAGAVVNFTINGKTVSALSDNEGIAKVEITDVPGTYEVTTTYNNQTYKNNVTVKLNETTCRITENKNIKVDYDGEKYFSVKVVSADGKVAASGVSVIFKINGKTNTVKTDDKGIAKIKITDVPNTYTMTTTFNGKSVKNTVTVKQVLKVRKVTVKKTAKKFTLKATLKINGKLIKGKYITFKFNGKNYKVKTNAKGVAQKTLNKKVIKKLKKGKIYTVKATYLKDSVKSSVKVK